MDSVRGRWVEDMEDWTCNRTSFFTFLNQSYAHLMERYDHI